MECRVKLQSHPVGFSLIRKIGYLYATIIPSGSSIASNFSAFRSICSSMNSLPSSEYIFQRMLLIPRTGNGERETWNGERGTGDGERGTGNGERGTGNGDGSLGTSVQRQPS